MNRHAPPDRVLCAVDFSRPSLIAASYAAVVADSLGADLVLCHVVSGVPDLLSLQDALGEDGDVPDSANLVKRWTSEALRQLEILADTLDPKPVILRLGVGSVAGEILHIADEVDADAIFVGSHGRRGFRRAVIGSVAERLVRWSPVPVTVVRWALQRDEENTGDDA